jgi:putative ABC transport system ATP-binding protein
LINGEDIKAKGLAAHRRNHIALIFQSYNLIDYMTTIQNVKLMARQEALPILEKLGLTREEANRNVLKLSGGQQQRVAIARALASDAPILLADEPTGNLDEDTAAEITNILKESAHAFQKCVVVVTHSNDVAKQADVILKLKRGNVQISEQT